MSIINFINDDCNNHLHKIPDNHYDLAIIDPEYGIKQGGQTNHTRSKLAKAKKYHSFNDNKPPEQKYFDEIFRISKNQIIWGANHFIERINKNSSCWIVWDKDNGKTDFADCELAWTSFKSAVRIYKYRWQGMLQQNMKKKQKRIHPTEKPIDLYRWLLQKFSKPGQLIIDTHGGSLSHAIAADMEDVNLDIYEIDKIYLNDGQNRYNEYKKQYTLFN